MPENCFEPVGKGGWPSISTWINSNWEYPLQTNMALSFIISPFSFIFFLKIHLVPTTFFSLGLGTSSQVLFFSICSSSSFISSIQYLIFLYSLNDLGSIRDNIECSESNASFLLVSTPAVLSPII
jgi:hypothetical protein